MSHRLCVRYIDTGTRDPAQALGTWLDRFVLAGASIAELRWQAGYFTADVLPYFAPALGRLGRSGGTVRVLVGSNDGSTRRADMAALLAAAGTPRAGLGVGVVSFDNGYFHPKTVHIVRSDGSAAAYVGSANLTGAGVALNVEAGIVLDTRDGDDRDVLAAVGAAIDWWFAGRRPGMHLVATAADLAALTSAGILDVPQPPRPRPAAAGRRSGGHAVALRPLLTIPSAAAPPPRPSPARPGASTPARWTKKLSASDAQRKGAGNQRGSITLVKARNPIDPRTYFRRNLFGSAAWTRGRTGTGKPLEVARVRFDVTLLGRRRGAMDIEVSYAPNREAAQSNYTSLLHLGPLATHFAARDMTGRQMTIERRANGTFALSIA